MLKNFGMWMSYAASSPIAGHARSALNLRQASGVLKPKPRSGSSKRATMLTPSVRSDSEGHIESLISHISPTRSSTS